MTEEEKEKLITVIRDRLTVAKYIVCAAENEKKSFADGYFKGWLDAILIILNALDRTDLLNYSESSEKVSSIAKMGDEAISETEVNGLVERIKSLFRSS